MSLNTENGTGMVMPVAPAYGGGYGGGFGNGFGGDGWWVLLLLLAFSGGWGMGGFGGGWGGAMMGMDYGLYPWLNNSQNINGGFRDQMLGSQISGIQNAITSGFGDVQTALCGGFAGVNAGISNAAAQAEISANARQMASMNQMFGLQSQFADCCCENRLGLAQLQNVVQSENCADRAAVSDGIRDLLAATQAQTQTILTQLCNDKIEQKNDTIAQLRSELMFARGQASQDVQTAAIQAGQRALANEVEQYVLPTPRPAYIVQNPNCCQPTGCGCGSF